MATPLPLRVGAHSIRNSEPPRLRYRRPQRPSKMPDSAASSPLRRTSAALAKRASPCSEPAAGQGPGEQGRHDKKAQRGGNGRRGLQPLFQFGIAGIRAPVREDREELRLAGVGSAGQQEEHRREVADAGAQDEPGSASAAARPSSERRVPALISWPRPACAADQSRSRARIAPAPVRARCARRYRPRAAAAA
jgi:hypothetical protein